MVAAVLLFFYELVVVDVVKLNENDHLMKDVVLLIVLLDNDDDVEVPLLLDFDLMKQDMYTVFLDQFELMDHEIQNEVFHLKTNVKRKMIYLFY